MKNFSSLILFLFVVLTSTTLFAQCPDPNPQTRGLYPNPLANGTVNSAYGPADVTIVFPKDTSITIPPISSPLGPIALAPVLVTFSSFTLDQQYAGTALPAGMAWDYSSCSSPNCDYPVSASNNRGCIKLGGTPTATGTFSPQLRATYIGSFPMPNVNNLNSFLGLPAAGTIIQTNNIPPALATAIPAGTIPDALFFGTGLTIGQASTSCTLTVNPPSQNVCPGQTVTVNVSGASTYSWVPGGFTGSSVTFVMPVGQPSGTFTITGTDAGGNVCTATAAIIVNPVPVADFTPSTTVVQPGGSVSFTNGTTGATSYQWFLNGSNFDNGTNPSIQINNTGSYDVMLIATNAAGCKDTVVKSILCSTSSCPVTVNPTSGSVCSDDANGVSITASSSNGSTFAWSPASGLNIATGATVIAKPTATTTYTVTATNGACNSTATVTVSVTPTPLTNLTVLGSAVCTGEAGTITIKNAQNGVMYSIQKNGSNVVAPLNGANADLVFNIPPSSLPNASNDFIIIAANGNCQIQFPNVVTIQTTAQGNVTFAGLSGAYCAGSGQTVTLLGVPSGGVFKINGVAISSSSFVIDASRPVGNYSVDYTVTGACAGTSSPQSFEIQAIPVAGFTPSATTAHPSDNISLTNTSTGASGYEWFSNGTSFSTQMSPTFTPSAVGSFEIQLVASTAAGCRDTANATIVVEPLVSIDNPLSSTTNVYPNPNYGAMTIEVAELPATVHVLDLMGKRIFVTDMLTNRETINVRIEHPGFYFVQISTPTGSIIRRVTILK